LKRSVFASHLADLLVRCCHSKVSSWRWLRSGHNGSALGQWPFARAVTADRLYADYRASTDQAVPNFIVVGDLATGQKRVVDE
jgi:hypothetical protein